jgi:hypothetical protein
MTAPVDVLAAIAAIAANNPNPRPAPITPTPDHDEHRERVMSCGTWDWAGTEWFMADVKGGQR